MSATDVNAKKVAWAVFWVVATGVIFYGAILPLAAAGLLMPVLVCIGIGAWLWVGVRLVMRSRRAAGT